MRGELREEVGGIRAELAGLRTDVSNGHRRLHGRIDGIAKTVYMNAAKLALAGIVAGAAVGALVARLVGAG